MLRRRQGAVRDPDRKPLFDRGITRAGLAKLKDRIVRPAASFRPSCPASRSNAPTYCLAGSAIIDASSTSWASRSCTHGDSALRLGVLYDLLEPRTTNTTSATNRCASS